MWGKQESNGRAVLMDEQQLGNIMRTLLFSGVVLLQSACSPGEDAKHKQADATIAAEAALSAPQQEGVAEAEMVLSSAATTKKSQTSAEDAPAEAPALKTKYQFNQVEEPVTFRLVALKTDVLDESFKPHFRAKGKMQLSPTAASTDASNETSKEASNETSSKTPSESFGEGQAFAANDVIQLWLAYELTLNHINFSHKGTLTMTLPVDKNSGLPEGPFELSVPLPRHDLSAEQADLTFDVLGWQKLRRARLIVQPMRAPKTP